MKMLSGRLFRIGGPLIVSAGALALSGCGSSGATVPSLQSFGGSNRQAGTAAVTPTTVTNLRDSGPGSLRKAIQNANALPAGRSSTIAFTVSGTIRLGSALPAIVRKVTIDGTSAPGYANKAPVVEIDANAHGGLVFGAGSTGSELLAVAIDGASGNGVTLNASSIVLNQNYIGLTRMGIPRGNRGDGVYVTARSANDVIGSNASNASGVVANVISGNAGNGVSLHGSSGDTIAANRIGTNPAGSMAVANGQNGIWITGASDRNEIGGTVYVDSATGEANDPTGDKGTVTPVFVVPPLGNLISGNRKAGILIDAGSEKNHLNGNFVGTNATGDAPIGNGGDGVRIDRANDNSLVGCKFVNNPFVYYNVVSGNGGNGLRIVDSDDVVVQGNFFGVGANNTNIVGNKDDGILIAGSSSDTQVGGVIPLGNVSAGNGLNGIEVTDTASGFITFNTFGGLLAFKGAAPNGNDGLLITATGGHQTVRTNVFSGNVNNGIEIAGNASDVTVDPNIVGLTTKGNLLLPNGGDGLRIAGTAHDITVGGYTQSVIPQNTFSGNRGYGVEITGRAHDNTVFNGDIGTNVTGTASLGNRLGGIYVGGSATRQTIGGATKSTSKPLRNIVSGNLAAGVILDRGSSYSTVVGNWIGLSRTGKRALPNAGKPIVVKPGSTHNVVKGNVTTPKS